MISGKQKKKDTVRIGKKDLLRLLHENEELHNLITDLQEQVGTLTEENLRLKANQYVGPVERHPDLGPEGPNFDGMPDDWGPGPGRSPDPNDPLPEFGPDVYIDGASRYHNDLND